MDSIRNIDNEDNNFFDFWGKYMGNDKASLNNNNGSYTLPSKNKITIKGESSPSPSTSSSSSSSLSVLVSVDKSKYNFWKKTVEICADDNFSTTKISLEGPASKSSIASSSPVLVPVSTLPPFRRRKKRKGRPKFDEMSLQEPDRMNPTTTNANEHVSLPVLNTINEEKIWNDDHDDDGDTDETFEWILPWIEEENSSNSNNNDGNGFQLSPWIVVDSGGKNRMISTTTQIVSIADIDSFEDIEIPVFVNNSDNNDSRQNCNHSTDKASHHNNNTNITWRSTTSFEKMHSCFRNKNDTNDQKSNKIKIPNDKKIERSDNNDNASSSILRLSSFSSSPISSRSNTQSINLDDHDRFMVGITAATDSTCIATTPRSPPPTIASPSLSASSPDTWATATTTETATLSFDVDNNDDNRNQHYYNGIKYQVYEDHHRRRQSEKKNKSKKNKSKKKTTKTKTRNKKSANGTKKKSKNSNSTAFFVVSVLSNLFFVFGSSFYLWLSIGSYAFALDVRNIPDIVLLQWYNMDYNSRREYYYDQKDDQDYDDKNAYINNRSRSLKLYSSWSQQQQQQRRRKDKAINQRYLKSQIDFEAKTKQHLRRNQQQSAKLETIIVDDNLITDNESEKESKAITTDNTQEYSVISSNTMNTTNNSDNDCGSNNNKNITGDTKWEHCHWFELPDIVKDAAITLGYDKSVWDSNYYYDDNESQSITTNQQGQDMVVGSTMFYTFWNNLSESEQYAVTVVFGYDSTAWDNNVFSLYLHSINSNEHSIYEYVFQIGHHHKYYNNFLADDDNDDDKGVYWITLQDLLAFMRSCCFLFVGILDCIRFRTLYHIFMILSGILGVSSIALSIFTTHLSLMPSILYSLSTIMVVIEAVISFYMQHRNTIKHRQQWIIQYDCYPSFLQIVALCVHYAFVGAGLLFMIGTLMSFILSYYYYNINSLWDIHITKMEIMASGLWLSTSLVYLFQTFLP